ncbi:MAG: LPXTG cell wall anchor domain-containing protein, partial [Lachnospiraceae bacterium]
TTIHTESEQVSTDPQETENKTPIPSTEDTNPDTGDSNSMFPLLVLIISSFAAIIAIGGKRRKEDS